MELTAALAGLEARGRLPDMVVSLGSAGSRALEQTEVYQATSVAYRDMDATPLGFATGVTPFLDLPATLPLPLRIPGIREATLSTGADIVSGAAYDAIAADMVDMESYAGLRACTRFAVPLVVLRGISDGKAELNHIDDWTEYLHIIDEKLAGAVDRLEAAIREGLLTR
ncbi:5'-methylthioadenosine/S-adenosylhomocysteine nucleosidase [Halomonas saccharevitans]|uniref:Adenosylhomocysteine nucleosidase n=1 Tax=Halomonas saccharevitans TaxID=416872 RepID=A0A1I7C567_9GAMM|nr:5'-methylthioadenosine/S-adenosylhomocysteine nucleosidase [Halomonas saccharevitans]SFT94571.1 adenosylhomocysteine nucleosidase [Halomonas saccharevitans]